ncbi:MAG: hypothetical protein EOO00_09875, partial [Chitinophagaceae bacterium]
RYHINGLQFYDWHNKHHKPLPVTGGTPDAVWKDIFNRDIYFNTVQKYITSAHGRNMKAMFYNLIYGAWESAELEGVSPEWYVYNMNTGQMQTEIAIMFSLIFEQHYMLSCLPERICLLLQ